MKKFDQLGRSLSKTEQKNVMGGLEDEGEGGGGAVCVDCGNNHLMCGDGRRCTAGVRSISCATSSGHTIYYCPS